MNEQPPIARVETKQRRLSALWFLPVAAMVGLVAVIGFQVGKARGVGIEIAFSDAAGLEPGAEIVHRGIAVGVVRSVELEPGLGGVIVGAELAPHAEDLASAGTRFWIARPQISLRGVSGLETILGPRYIEARPGVDGGQRATAFEGLDSAPPPDGGSGDLLIRLLSRSAASLSAGSPVLYKGVRVGAVQQVELAPDASAVEMVVAIEPEHARLVRVNSRFWVSGGVGFDFGIFSGLSVQASSLDSLIEAGIAFATPNRPGDEAPIGHTFAVEPEADSDWLEWSPSLPQPAAEPGPPEQGSA